MMRSGRTIVLFFATVLCIGPAAAGEKSSSTAEPKEHVVKITGFKFIPETLVVKSGDTITWINKDIAPHTATADDMSFDTGELKLNESGSIKVTADQSISYFCRFHPTMRASLNLQ